MCGRYVLKHAGQIPLRFGATVVIAERIALPDQPGELGQRVGRRFGRARAAATVRIIAVAAITIIHHQVPSPDPATMRGFPPSAMCIDVERVLASAAGR